MQRPRRLFRLRTRHALLRGVVLVLAAATPTAAQPPADPSFEAWLGELKAEAQARGISEGLVTRAFDGVTPLPVVLERDQRQPEFTITLQRYLTRRLSPGLVRNARRQFERHRVVLQRAQQTYGVDPATIVSIWALESNFGRFSGVRPTIPALATLAFDPRRSSFFREEIFHALRIVDRGDVALEQLRGSWAGAMGQPQFMPSSYERYAVDFDGDAKKDIWRSASDVVGSIANYLKAHGWVTGLRWGRRVQVGAAVPEEPSRMDGCRAARELSSPRPLDEWQKLGVRLAGGQALPASRTPASLLTIDADRFLVYANYEALLGYNCAHTYALSVALLAERLSGQ